MIGISKNDASSWIQVEDPHIAELFALAYQERLSHRGRRVSLCGIINAKSGGCPEDCGFCGQSAHATTEIGRFGLVTVEKMVEHARTAAQHGMERFCIVTAGRAIRRDSEVATIARAIETIVRETAVDVCASLGNVEPRVLETLRDAGLSRYHSNLESAESYWSQVCSTRRWTDTVETLQAAKSVGLSICSCGIFGLGESAEQRVELLLAIRDLDAESVPLNFLHPIRGTRFEGKRCITPMECLKAVAVARLMMPDKEIRVCGGRRYNLRDLQSWVLVAGADGLMVGNYLTTEGRNIADDLRMIADADMKPARPSRWVSRIGA